MKGAQKVRARAEALQREIERNKDRAARSAANALAVAMKAEAPVEEHPAPGKRRGKLRRSIRVRKVPEGYTVGPRSKLAHLVIRGTAPHAEAPKSKRALAFSGGGGSIFFAASVQNPGARANPFVNRTLEATRPEAVEAAKIALRGGPEVPDAPE